MIRYWLLVIMLCSFCGIASADAIDDLFNRLDRNQDQKLSKDELPPNAQRNFERADKNNNQSISREEHRTFLSQRPNAQPNLPETLVSHFDLPYAATENPRQRLDLLLPKTAVNDQPLPVVVFIHGGAWQSGDKRAGLGQIRPLVETGKYAGVSVGYRLTAEAIWPAQIYDCKAAIRWIRGNAKKYNLDPDRIAVMGASAGGHLALMLGTSGEVKNLEGELGEHTDQPSKVTCVVNLFGPSNLPTMGKYESRLDHNSERSPEGKLIGGSISENLDRAKAASPITYVTENAPPFLHIHGLKDTVVPYQQAEEIHAALEKAKVPSELVLIENGGHGGFAPQDYIPQVTAFLEKHLLQTE